MFRRLRFAVIACCTVLLLSARGGEAAVGAALSPVGTWLTASGKGVVEIATCGKALCGRIVGIDRAPGEPMPRDVYGQPQCGLTIITDERRATDARWRGWVTDPRDGNTYHAQLWVDAKGNLNVRGYLGVPLLGETQVWHRFTGRLSTDCGLA